MYMQKCIQCQKWLKWGLNTTKMHLKFPISGKGCSLTSYPGQCYHKLTLRTVEKTCCKTMIDIIISVHLSHNLVSFLSDFDYFRVI